MESDRNLKFFGDAVGEYKPSGKEWFPAYGLYESFKNYVAGRPSAICDYKYGLCYILEQALMTSGGAIFLSKLISESIEKLI